MRFLASSLLILLLAACASARQRPVDSPESTKVLHRAFEHTHVQHMLFCYIPAHPDFAKDTGNMAKMIGYTAKKHQPLVIYSPDPEVATRMITIAFATIAPDALRGATVVAAIGEKNDSYVRPVVEKTGAKLYVDPLPVITNRSNQAMQPTASRRTVHFLMTNTRSFHISRAAISGG